MTRVKVAIGQAGAGTTVVNASLFGFLEEALSDHEVYGIVNGLQGLDEDTLILLTEALVDRHCEAALAPGAWLGAGRWPADEEDFAGYVANLKERDVHRLVLIGGNGTMWSCLQLERAAARMGYELAVLGIPKTVDNDLAGTDHAPGFGSAARFVATMARDVGRDLAAVRNFEDVRVLETMGRNVGWLALSSGYLKRKPEDPPHLIYVPERGFDRETFLDEIKETHHDHGYAVAFVSEGLPSHGTDNHMSSPNLGGVARELAVLVSEELGLVARGELLGMGQRSYSLAVSGRDRDEARMLGAEAARALRDGAAGVMLGLCRISSSPYEVQVRRVPFGRIAGIERPLPEEWLLPAGEVHEEFQDWLRPLVGEDLAPLPAGLSEEVERWKTGR